MINKDVYRIFTMTTEISVLTLPLTVRPYQAEIIDQRFEDTRKVYNAMLGYELEKLRRMQENPDYISVTQNLYELAKDSKRGEKEYKEAGKRRREVIREHGFSEFEFIADVAKFAKYYSFNVANNPASISVAQPMWRAFESFFYGKGEIVHYKRKDSINSITSNGKSFLRITDADGKTVLNYSGEGGLNITYGSVRGHNKVLILPIIIEKDNPYIAKMMSYPIKQVRLLRKREKGKYNYYVQLCLEGKPALKYNVDGTEKYPIGSGKVGLYITTKTVTVASKQGVKKYNLSEGNRNYQAEVAELQQFMENSRRATNPDNFNPDGTIKNGRVVEGQRLPLEWNFSKQYLKAKDRITELKRLERVHRQLHHQKLANAILELGSDIRVNDYSFELAARRKKEAETKSDGTQLTKKRSGKNINQNAPAMLLQMIERKLNNLDKSLIKIDLKEAEGFSITRDDSETWARYLYELQ